MHETTLSGYKRAASPSIIAAGLCILAEDTGRVLMLQRSFKETDAAAGKWEFPGGHLNDGESPLEGARREFEEEVGHRLPAVVSVRADYVDGIYQLFVATVPDETAIKINRPLDRRVRNPDGDEVETVAWWQPKDMENNKSIRAELARVVSSKLKWAIRLAKLRARRMEKTASILDRFEAWSDANPAKAQALIGAGIKIPLGIGIGLGVERLRPKEDRNYAHGALIGGSVGTGLAASGALRAYLEHRAKSAEFDKTAAGYLEQVPSAIQAAVGAVGKQLGGIDTRIRQLAQRISSDPVKASTIRAAIYGGGAGALMGATDDPGYDENGKRRSRLGNIVGQGLTGASIGGVASRMVGYPDGYNHWRNAIKAKLGGMDGASLRTRVGLLRFEQKFASVRRAETAQTLAADIVSRMTAKTAEGGLKETISKMLGDASTWAGKKFDQAKSIGQSPSPALQSAVDRIKGWADDPDKRLMLTSLIGAGVGGATMVGAEAMNSQKRKKRYLNALLTGAAGGGLTGLGGGLLYNASTGDLAKQYNRAFGDAAQSGEQTELLTEARKQAPTRNQVEVETARQKLDNVGLGGSGAATAGAAIGATVGGGLAGKQSLSGNTHTEQSLARSNEMRNFEANRKLQLKALDDPSGVQAFNKDANTYSALARGGLTGPNINEMNIMRAVAPGGYLHGRPVDAKLLKKLQVSRGSMLDTHFAKMFRDAHLTADELAGLQAYTRRLSTYNKANPTAPLRSFTESQEVLRKELESKFNPDQHAKVVRDVHEKQNAAGDAMRLSLQGGTRRATYDKPLDKFLYGGPKRRGLTKTIGRTIGGAVLGGIAGEAADQGTQYFTGGEKTLDFNKQFPNVYRDDL